MKARGILVTMVVLGYSAAFAQAEYDDVYFSRKDRQKQQAAEPKSLKKLDKATNEFPVLAKANRKMEGYTGRTINPDYQDNYSTGTEVSSYFVPNYQPVSTSGNGFNTMYAGNGCYSCNSGWGMNRFNRMGFGMSPFYSPFSSSWGYSPYGYNSYWNDPWNNYGYNSWNSWGNPYSSWGNPYYGSGWGMGYSYGWGNNLFGGWYSNNYYTRPTSNGSDNQVTRVYGKRSSRNSGVVNETTTGRNGQVVSGGQQGGVTRGGRVATTGTSTGSRYYQRGWRQDPTVNPSSAGTGTRTRSAGWGSGTSNPSRTSTWGNTNSDWPNTWGNGGTSGGSRSSSFGTGGGSRSSGGSFGGGSSGGSRPSGGGSHSGGGSRGRN